MKDIFVGASNFKQPMLSLKFPSLLYMLYNKM